MHCSNARMQKNMRVYVIQSIICISFQVHVVKLLFFFFFKHPVSMMSLSIASSSVRAILMLDVKVCKTCTLLLDIQ